MTDGDRDGRRFAAYLYEVHPETQQILQTLEFIRNFGGGEVLRRTSDQLLIAARREWLLALRELSTESLVAVALMENVGPFTELGSVVVRHEFRGFGLHSLLIRVRAAKLAETVGMSAKPVSVPTNERSSINLVAAGFEMLQPYPCELLGPCAQCRKPIPAGKVCCSEAYGLSPQRFRECCAEFVRLGSRAVLRRPDGARLDVLLLVKPASDGRVRRRLEVFTGFTRLEVK